MAKLRAALPSDPACVASDERLEAYLSFQLFLLIQDSVDLAAHLVAALGLAVPFLPARIVRGAKQVGDVLDEFDNQLAVDADFVYWMSGIGVFRRALD